jgi:hypothetical protein
MTAKDEDDKEDDTADDNDDYNFTYHSLQRKKCQMSLKDSVCLYSGLGSNMTPVDLYVKRADVATPPLLPPLPPNTTPSSPSLTSLQNPTPHPLHPH